MRCFGPLEPVYDWDEIAREATRESIERGPRSLWRYADLLPAVAPRTPRSARVHAARPGAAARAGARRRRGPAEARHREPDALVQGPRRRRRCRQGGRARLRHARLRLDRQPRERGRGARRGERHARGRLFRATVEPEKLLATAVYGAEIYAVRGSYDDCSRLVSELAGEVDWGFVNVNLRAYYAEGSKTLAFEIAEQLGWETPDAVVSPDRLRLALHQALAGLRAVPPARAGRRATPAHLRRPGRGLRAGRAGVRRGAAGVAGAAEHDRALARDRQPGRRRSRDRDRAGVGRRDLRRRRGRGRREHVAARRDRRASSARRRPASRSARCARRPSAATLGADDRVVVLVTGTGLKTPQVVETRAGIEIDPDVDELLEQLGVTA